MGIYEEFAYFYSKGDYTLYSEVMLEILPSVLEHFNIVPKSILDLACGEGTFSRGATKIGYKVTGVDRSKYMLNIAIENAKKDGLNINFLEQDIRFLDLKDKFDLAVCWYDSLNYVLTTQDLEKVFFGVSKILENKGHFIFDMNTIYGLALISKKYLTYVRQETDELFEIHKIKYNFENSISTVNITGFMKDKDNKWIRFDEEHLQRGFTITEIRNCFIKNGFEELACWGSFRQKSELLLSDPRVWFVLQNKCE